jgi:transposase
MLDKILLPSTEKLRLDEYHIEEDSLILSISSTLSHACCPKCGNASYRVHSQYQRSLMDLPCAGRSVWLEWTVRRFFCDEPNCPQLTFTEQLPEIGFRYARQTKRLLEQKRNIAFEVSGEVGQRLSGKLEMPMSGDQALRLVRNSPEKTDCSPKVLGVDDWAYRKGQVYGTILVDLEMHQVIDLLPDREAETLATWLKEHPEVELVSRDRSQQYIQGIKQGAPQAKQVADRFHLLQNLGDVLKKVFDGCSQELRQAQKQITNALVEKSKSVTNATMVSEPSPPNDDVTPSPGKQTPDSHQRTSYTQERFSEVKKLQDQGLGQREMARQLHLSRATVKRYCLLDALPAKSRGSSTTSKTVPFMAYLAKRWQEGCHSRQKLFQEIQEQGFQGSYSSLWRALNQFPDDRPPGSGLLPQSSFLLSPRQASWLLMIQPEKFKPDQEIAYQVFCQVSQTATELSGLAREFCEMVRGKTSEGLDVWLSQAGHCKIPEIERFANGLRGDYDAVKAALSLCWSNGQTEGQVHRLKLIKRQMYGRASFDLLRRKVIGLLDTS